MMSDRRGLVGCNHTKLGGEEGICLDDGGWSLTNTSRGFSRKHKQLNPGECFRLHLTPKGWSAVFVGQYGRIRTIEGLSLERVCELLPEEHHDDVVRLHQMLIYDLDAAIDNADRKLGALIEELQDFAPHITCNVERIGES